MINYMSASSRGELLTYTHSHIHILLEKLYSTEGDSQHTNIGLRKAKFSNV